MGFLLDLSTSTTGFDFFAAQEAGTSIIEDVSNVSRFGTGQGTVLVSFDDTFFGVSWQFETTNLPTGPLSRDDIVDLKLDEIKGIGNFTSGRVVADLAPIEFEEAQELTISLLLSVGWLDLLNLGSDNIVLSNFDDVVEGGRGNDDISAGDGENQIFGEQGRDRIEGGKDGDTLSGGAQKDTIWGLGGDDVIFGGTAKDTLYGGDHDDEIYGEDGNDTINGGAGFDMLFGGDDDDTLVGGADDDELFGEDGRDTLKGGAGDDELDGGKGRNKLIGGADEDTFIFSGGRTTIKDFTLGEDFILSNVVPNDVGSVQEFLDENAQRRGANKVVIDYTGLEEPQGTLIIKGVSRVSDLYDNFEFNLL